MRGLLDRLLARRRESAGEGVSDFELLCRFTHDRDEAAFELLVWRHGGMVLGLCRRALRDEQLSEDAFQAVFLVLARRAGAVRGNLGGWLFKVARRVAARAAKNRPVVQPVVEPHTQPPVDSVERAELAAILDAEIARLPDRLRRPVVLCYLGERSTEDAARELGCPRGTVLSRLATARKHLAERLLRRGVVLPTTLFATALSGRLVSSAVGAALPFRSGSLALSTATQLADGVLHAMNRVTLFTVMGGVILAAALASGVGWVAAQQGANPEDLTAGEERAAPAAPTVPKRPAAEPPAPPQPDEARKAADEKLRKLERTAEALKLQIETSELQIKLLVSAGGRDNNRLAQLQKHLAEVEEVNRRTSRDQDRLEIELSVLKDALSDKDVNSLVQSGEANMRIDKLKIEVKITKGVREKLEAERDLLKQQIAKLDGGEVDATALRKALEPQRELLARIQREMLLLQLQRDGVVLTNASGTEGKLDAILRELAALRKDVEELKEQKKK
jgi:RNA polymerase sigma factor (sigma-70 family)